MFGTNDIIYVPEGEQLLFDDVYRWRRFAFDVGKLGLRVRTVAFEQIAERIRGALEVLSHNKRFAERAQSVAARTDGMIHDLSLLAGGIQGELPGTFKELMQSQDAAWWVRLSDHPAESFDAEDYEHTVHVLPGDCTPHMTYGLVNIAQLDDLDLQFADDDEYGLPFAIDVPHQGGLTISSIPPLEPLPLVREFCGVHGVSAFGRTVNMSTLADIVQGHEFSTPMGRIGGGLFATLYIHYGVAAEAPVIAKLREEHVGEYLRLLERSQFAIRSSGPNWRILEREGDIVHLYLGLPGKESEGIDFIPPCLLVAAAAGQFDPMLRSELLEAIRETAG